MPLRGKTPVLSSHSTITALLATLLSSLLFHRVTGLLTSVDCRWPDGTDSNGRIPCNADAERSPCCLGSEVCLENNLCFGGVGLIYRSACAGGWGDNATCPEFCNDLIPDTWANIWPCPGQGNEGPTQFWCGHGNVCDTRATFNSSFFPIVDYRFQGRLIVGGPPITTADASASAAATATSSTSPTECPDGNNKQALTIGAGVGGPLVLLALALASWAIVERRRRKRVVANLAHGGMNGELQPALVGMFGRPAEKVELSSVSPLRNDPDAYLARHELQ